MTLSVIRLKGNTKVSAADGTTRPAADWIGQGGRARKLRDATVTEARRPVGASVLHGYCQSKSTG